MVNPIFMRVMNTSGRQRRHVWVRTVYLAVILMTLTVMMLVEMTSYRGEAALAQLGESLFRTISFVQLVLILFLSPVYTAGAISQERDAQTFGVLLATPLSNLQIVLGSLLSRLFFVLAILVSTLPVFALLYYFGGFELTDVFLSYGIAASSALLTGAVAVAVSIVTTGTRRVMIGFFLFVTAYLVGVWVLDHMLLVAIVPGYVEGSLDWLHPIAAMQRTLIGGQVVRPLWSELGAWDFLVQYPEYGYVAYSTALSVVIIVLGAVLVRRLARGYGGLARRLGQALYAVAGAAVAVAACAVLIRYRGPAQGLAIFLLVALPVAAGLVFFRLKRHRKPKTVWDNPIAWRERVTRTATARRTLVQFLYILLSVLALYVLLVLKVGGGSARDARVFVLVVTTTQMFIILMVGATMAASSISYEREQGTLDMILATPITPRYFIHGKLFGIIRYLGMFLAMMLLVTLGAYLIARLPVEEYLGSLVPPGWARAVAVPSGATGYTPRDGAWSNWSLRSIVYPLVTTGGLAAAMATLGMTFSLRARKTATAAIYAALSVLGVAATVTCCCSITGLIWVVGPIAAMASPFLTNCACFMPESFMETFNFSDSVQLIGFYRYFGMHVGVLGAAAGYGVFAWLRVRGMVKTFDQQVRQKV